MITQSALSPHWKDMVTYTVTFKIKPLYIITRADTGWAVFFFVLFFFSSSRYGLWVCGSPSNGLVSRAAKYIISSSTLHCLSPCRMCNNICYIYHTLTLNKDNPYISHLPWLINRKPVLYYINLIWWLFYTVLSLALKPSPSWLFEARSDHWPELE